MTRGGPWEERPGLVDRLRADWDAGYSTSEIGRRLGVGKNAVISKARREGLVPRPSPIKQGGPKGREAIAARRARAAARSALLANGTLSPAPSSAPKPSTPPRVVDPLRRGGYHQVPRTTLPPQSGPAAPQQAAPRVRNRTCAFPLNDRRPWRFCEAPVLELDKPYCPACCAKAYRPFNDRREAA